MRTIKINNIGYKPIPIEGGIDRYYNLEEAYTCLEGEKEENMPKYLIIDGIIYERDKDAKD